MPSISDATRVTSRASPARACTAQEHCWWLGTNVTTSATALQDLHRWIARARCRWRPQARSRLRRRRTSLYQGDYAILRRRHRLLLLSSPVTNFFPVLCGCSLVQNRQAAKGRLWKASKAFKLHVNHGTLWAYLIPSSTRSEGVCVTVCV